MRLISLKTKSFKKLGDFECEFGLGLNVISGDNFTGKSTLLQAIEAALFGVTVVPGKAENIPTWGQHNFSLELCFDIRGEEYMITRNKSTAKLQRLPTPEHGMELVANGNTPVKAAIEELLGCSAKDYNLFIQSRQGESAGVLTFGATALNRKVEEHAGVDLIEKVQGLAQIRATRLLERASNRPTEEQLQDAEARVSQAFADEAAAQQAHLDLQRELDAFGECKVAPVANVAPTMRKALHEAQLLEAKLDAAEAAVVPAQKVVDEARQRIGSRVSVDSAALEGQLEQAYTKGLEAKKEVDRLRDGQQAYTQAKQSVERCERVRDTAKGQLLEKVDPEELARAEKQLEEMQEAVTTARSLVAQAEVKVRNLKDLADGAVCPTCGQAKAEHDPAKLAQELKGAQEDLQRISDSAKAAAVAESSARALLVGYKDQDGKAQASILALQVAEEALLAAEYALGDLPVIDDSQIHDADAAHQAARDEYAGIQAQLKGVKTENERLRADYEALQRAEVTLATAQQEANKLAAEFEALEEPPTEEQIAAEEKAYQDYLAAAQAWREKHSDLSTRVSQALYERNHRTTLWETARDANDALKRDLQRAVEAEIEAKKCERLVRFLRDGRQGYMKQVWSTILAISSRLVRDASSGAITRIENDDGEFLFEEDGVLAPTTSASGAQKSFIGGALRIGLGRALYGSDSLLIFDEPTESCSERHATGMSAMLATSAKQVLLITHRENDQALAQHIINVGA